MYYDVFNSTKSLRLKWNLLFPSLSLCRCDFICLFHRNLKSNKLNIKFFVVLKALTRHVRLNRKGWS